MVILTGTWTDIGHEFFSETRELRSIGKLTQASREPTYVKENSNLTKARELAARHDIDRAVVQYEYGLSNREWAQANQTEWRKNIQTLLGLTLRVRNDPALTLELISTFIDRGSVPENMRSTISVWRKHAKEWALSPGSNRSVAANIAEVKELLDRAEQLQGNNPAPASLVLYLRSAALLNSILEAPEQGQNQEALLLAGRSAEGLEDKANLVSYYQRCVDIDPNSNNGQLCRERLARL